MNQRIVAFSIVVTAAAWSLAGFGLTTDRENALKHAEQNGLNLARVFAQNTARVFAGIDQTLLRLRDDYRASRTGFSLTAWSRQWPYVHDRALELSITDARGSITHSSNPAAAAQLGAGHDNLAFHAANADDVSYIGRPAGNGDGTVSLSVSRPIRGRAGELSGLVVASVHPESLSQFYRGIDVGRSGFVSVIGTDGITRARAPFAAPLLDAATIENPALARFYDRSEGCHPEVSRLDSVERLVCFRRLDKLPLLVSIGLSKDEFLAGYYRARWRYLGAAAAITLIMALMTLWLVRHEHKLVRTTQALSESEYRSAQKSDILEITLENMSQGIFLIEADSHITVINRRARELFDLPDALVNDDLTLKKVVDWQWETGEYGTDGEAVDPELRAFLQSGALANSPPVYVRTRPNGTVLEVRTVMLPSGGAVRTLTDITDYRRTQQQLAAAKEAAESGYRSKSAFLATMSHEIRTPLNGVVGMASLLLDTELTPEQRKSVETIQECSDALLELISDVLDFSKLEAGRLDVETRAFNLIELCEAVFNIIEPRARSKNVTLVFAPSAKLPAMIESDSARLRQVLLNLVGNALKFTDSGAVILQALPVGGGGAAGRARFEVTDTGIGISAEAQQRLFNEFTQVEASITRRYGGTGLGLAICKKIVAAMGGEIGVHSEVGKGSTFWFELPFTASDAAPAPLLQTVPAGLTAALIADDDDARGAVGTLLREIGLNVVAGSPPGELAKTQVALVHVHHPVALDLIRGKVPAGAGKLQFLGYGFGSLSFSSRNFSMIDGALTPSSVVRALASTGICGNQAALPAAAPRTAAVAPKRSATSLAILLAEDNAVNQRIASSMLSNMGHTVDIAGNGRDAVAKATLRVYDVIIMDMQMPEMDGLEATRAIRALHGPEGHVPIIAMTANAFAADRSACMAAGMNDFLTKPITARKLFDAIEPWASGVTRSRDAAADDDAADAEPPIDPDLIDPQQMRMIQEEVGGEVLHELLISFWADAGGLLQELQLALSGEGPMRASTVLHTLKGAAASLGLIGCSQACEAARTAIAEGRAPDLDTLMTVMFKTLQATQPRIVEARRAAKAA